MVQQKFASSPEPSLRTEHRIRVSQNMVCYILIERPLKIVIRHVFGFECPSLGSKRSCVWHIFQSWALGLSQGLKVKIMDLVFSMELVFSTSYDAY
jgi:hypothetical protein